MLASSKTAHMLSTSGVGVNVNNDNDNDDDKEFFKRMIDEAIADLRSMQDEELDQFFNIPFDYNKKEDEAKIITTLSSSSSSSSSSQNQTQTQTQIQTQTQTQTLSQTSVPESEQQQTTVEIGDV